MPRLLDGDDALAVQEMLLRLIVLSFLLVWTLLLVFGALGLGVRVFLMAKGG